MSVTRPIRSSLGDVALNIICSLVLPVMVGYSLSFWLNVADDGGQAGLIRLFEFCSAANENLLRVVIKGGELTVVCRTRLAFPRIRFNPNRWYHVVVSTSVL